MALSLANRTSIDATCNQLKTMALSTAPIDRAACVATISRAYAYFGLSLPSIAFCDNPLHALEQLVSQAPHPRPTVARPRLGVSPEPPYDFDPDALWKHMQASQPRHWPELGDEVGLNFHSELNDLLEPFQWDIELLRPLSARIDRHLGDVIHFAHTVDRAIDNSVELEHEVWLTCTQAAASLWGEVVELALVEALYQVGAIKSLAPQHQLARELLGNAGWIYSFEKLCIVCDRPSGVQQVVGSGRPRRVDCRLEWRDGAAFDYHFE